MNRQPLKRPARSGLVAVASLAVTAMVTMTGCTGGTSGKHDSKQITNGPIAELHWAYGTKLASLDFAAYPANNPITPLVTEPLERLSSSMVYTPLLATAVTRPNPTTLVYTIRPDVKFSDGQPLTAQDVVWSIQHGSAHNAGSAFLLPQIQSVTATGQLSVTVKLVQPDPIARAKIAQCVYIQEKSYAEQHEKTLGTATAVPVGTGPYNVSSYTDQGITLTRNPSYWGTAPTVEKVDFPLITDDNAVKLAVDSGKVDGTMISSLDTAHQWRQDRGVSVYSSPTGSETGLRLDVTKPPFDDEHLRRAIAYATDKVGMVKVAFGGEATALDGLVPANQLSDVAGGMDEATAFVSSLPKLPFDLSRAKAELAKSAHPQGLSITLTYGSPQNKKIGLILQEDLKKIGVNLQLKELNNQEFFSALQSGKLPPFGVDGFGTSANDPSGLLTQMVKVGSLYNYSHWTTPEVGAAVGVVDSAQHSPAERWAATKTILSAAASAVPYIPVAVPSAVFVLRSGYTFATKKGIDIYDFINGDWIYQVRATK